jgi:LmbE family N-acetylglucosaminyl deacetylase
LGAHSDDLEIGCGGTVLALLASRQVAVTWVVLSATGARAEEAEASAQMFLGGAEARDVRLATFRDGYFFTQGGEVKDYLADLAKQLEPDLIFTHYEEDRHQDHRLISRITQQLFRDHFILEYEVPKYDGDLGAPNVFFPLPEEIYRRKLELLAQNFPSQQPKYWFDEGTFSALMRLRGVESKAPSGFAEAFYGRKLVIQIPSEPSA